MEFADAGSRTTNIHGEAHPFDPGQDWAVRRDDVLEAGVDPDRVHWVQSACVLCSNGCGLDIGVVDGRMVGVRGRDDDHVNRGRLGPKGLYGWRAQQHRDRLTVPLVRDGGSLREATWDEAMRRIVARSAEALDAHGPLSHGFYTSGQLMLEEYYALAVIGKAGIGTPHMDGNTRLCTATAAMSLKESFGADGQPGCYEDFDQCDAIFAFGHNITETQTVLWRRILDRLEGHSPPSLVCVDPRRTEVARRADLHLPIRPGTNLALMNGLMHQLIENEWYDPQWVRERTVGFDELARVAAHYPPARVAEICDLNEADVREAARIFGTRSRVVSTVLQGVYQSHQATAAACGVNNLHLVRGMLGSPGAGLLQMNGQPTAQNNRETGADGDLPGFRNWDNIAHIRQLAKLWDVDESVIPHWSPPTHAMQIFRYVEQGSIRFLWIAGTNPAVSLPELARARDALAGDQCFVVVNDAYPTETTDLADVVLPSALWGEKHGTFTNADRTVHLAEKAVSPPKEARSDLDIWVDYAHRMGFRDNSGRLIPRWTTPQEVFDAWRECSRGRPCDYSALSYDRLRRTSGIQWPCTEDAPNGTARLYTDPVFPTGVDECEIYGHDLSTGGTLTRDEYKTRMIETEARLTAVHYYPSPHAPDDDYPMSLVTGRTATHFHTRTKTARVRTLDDVEPYAWAQISDADAQRYGLKEGDRVRIATKHGALDLPLRVGACRDNTVFVPFHYGEKLGVGAPANRLTITAWDPVSKQPTFKLVGARIEYLEEG